MAGVRDPRSLVRYIGERKRKYLPRRVVDARTGIEHMEYPEEPDFGISLIPIRCITCGRKTRQALAEKFIDPERFHRIAEARLVQEERGKKEERREERREERKEEIKEEKEEKEGKEVAKILSPDSDEYKRIYLEAVKEGKDPEKIRGELMQAIYRTVGTIKTKKYTEGKVEEIVKVEPLRICCMRMYMSSAIINKLMDDREVSFRRLAGLREGALMLPEIVSSIFDEPRSSQRIELGKGEEPFQMRFPECSIEAGRREAIQRVELGEEEEEEELVFKHKSSQLDEDRHQAAVKAASDDFESEEQLMDQVQDLLGGVKIADLTEEL
jgi:DNA-directed RNA polymerase subunit N (RpoN/RPB10)